MPEAKFPLGRSVITANALNTLDSLSVQIALARHAQGDWGDVCKDDHRANEQALKQGARLFSVYRDTGGVKFWIITEADRSVTTVLLPNDY